MDDRTKTVAASGIIIGFFLIIIIIGIMLTGKKVLSPVPEEGAIKIIFLTPTPISLVTPSATITVTPTSKTR
ncbi:MAG: hypothetical protein UW37_C0033G0006 [Candidatus Gottesmanbacteria bacterium GW2011_GWA2_44_17]|uniref:Uncharacterized protein n=2 Tax=Candidatus Gottesmaniibacteriota TaxID=1752720 RepID=A0A0G1KE06_9BACT|nr:MAG: hypothetical protein UV17_C0054G0006 [Candidatus Gottesmanbacteria bacterium GW2011_GWA1_42_26]KKS88022.1 MAG: hypothetical protein UV63_C0045G0006 [Microgenomates group bacterium GW2011_GWC1_43_11]KKT34561.1 MAG: hypothetical protein UW22_C0071G0007 [Candidatus Gottesmanbacteria bacterium GW2011_GWB1_44_11c]KKT46064.1 MAG: hypothetical protein UW37_C0033G0006 [Candidatus Gottesmanbacteria bacterium GW2011_GWA2_44_17]HCM82380.1 hypothetical protein [Patescibacteria group bacterium]